MFSKKIVLSIVYCVLFLYLSLFFFQKVNLTASDLGRHIQNGNVILETHSVFNTNFYSYTQPDFSVINHHWLFGALVSEIYRFFGFNGITFFSVVVHLSALGFLLWYIKRFSSHSVVVVALMFALPLLTYRTEFRPESISYLFIVLFYISISKLVRENVSLLKVLLLLVPLQIIWVNTHIFFIMSLGIVGVFGIQSLFKKDREITRKLFITGVSLVLASLVNPSFIQGFLQPLQIFNNYGYKIAENQGLLFLTNYSFQPFYGYVFVISLSVGLSIGVLLFKKNPAFLKYLPEILLCISFILFGFKINRLLSFTGIFVLPTISLILYEARFKMYELRNNMLNNTGHLIVGSTLGLLVCIPILATGLFFPHQALGVGVMDTINNSAQFFKENKLKGPVFNNYDIGGYLIFHLYPTEKVFVDNLIGGIAWGLGSGLGATIVLTLLGFLLARSQELPFIGQIVQNAVNTIESVTE